MLKELASGLADALQFDWRAIARPDQLLPPARPADNPQGDWVYWLLLAGRGFGKTRTGAEAVRQWIKDGFNLVNLIGATTDDVIGILIEGESGLMSICPKDELPRLNTNKRRLEWPNGAKSLYFSAEEPDRLRGKQHMKLVCDELAAWRYPDAWDQALFGLRLGPKPQAVIMTTPRPIKIIRELIADPLTHITRGSTYDNAQNLAAPFLKKIIGKYENTRLGRQELNAEILEEIEGALWTHGLIENHRVRAEDAPQYSRIVVAVDPAISTGENSDETGIVVAARGQDGEGYVLEDLSGKFLPVEWASKAVAAFHKWKADRIVAESNQGGAMVEAVIRTVDENAPIKLVHASRGKVARAEPISALYEQGKIHHVGSLPALEDQLTTFEPGATKSPDRLDALVWGLSELFIGSGNNTAIIEFYRREVEAQQRAGGLVIESQAQSLVRLRAPEGLSTAYLLSGECLTIPADRLVQVIAGDAPPLLAAGFIKEV